MAVKMLINLSLGLSKIAQTSMGLKDGERVISLSMKKAIFLFVQTVPKTKLMI